MQEDAASWTPAAVFSALPAMGGSDSALAGLTGDIGIAETSLGPTTTSAAAFSVFVAATTVAVDVSDSLLELESRETACAEKETTVIN